MLCWIVRAKKDGIAALDANGVETSLSVGQRGWVSQAVALMLALAGDVEMLSPDGVTALQQEKVKPNGVQTKTEGPAKTKTEAAIDEKVSKQEIAEDAPAAGIPASVAPLPPRKGPQLKPLGK